MHRTLHKTHAARKSNLLSNLWWNARKAYFYWWLERRWGGFIDLRASIGDDIDFLHGPFGVFIANGAVIGDRATIGHKVTIGLSADWRQRDHEAPIIGNDVLIGAGTSIIGRCRIGDGAQIGAGVVLANVDVPAGATIVNMSAYDLTNHRWAHHRNPLAHAISSSTSI